MLFLSGGLVLIILGWNLSSNTMGVYELIGLTSIATGIMTVFWLFISNRIKPLTTIQKIITPEPTKPIQEQSVSVESRPPVMYCSKCNTEMDRGYTQATNWEEITRLPSFLNQNIWLYENRSREKKPISTYACPNCGYLESYIPIKGKNGA